MYREFKPGYKTTEFWLTVAVGLVSLLFSVGVFDESIRDALISLVSAIVVIITYIMSRAHIKTSGTPEG
jgi:energy-converting hydrogenase Eha subunit C